MPGDSGPRGKPGKPGLPGKDGTPVSWNLSSRSFCEPITTQGSSLGVSWTQRRQG